MYRLKTLSRRGPASCPGPSRPFVFIWPALGLTLRVITLLETLRYQLICQSAPSIQLSKMLRSLHRHSRLCSGDGPRLLSTKPGQGGAARGEG